jgi:CRISPR-associated endonuclease Csn1
MVERNNDEFVLGIDLGTNSLGWSIIGLVDGEPASLIRAGVRVFEAGMDDSKGLGREESRNKARRDARSHRRQLWRHQRRLLKLARMLQRFGLLPAGDLSQPEARQDFFNRLDSEILQSPWFSEKEASANYPAPRQVMAYILRAAALDECLEPHFLGRALYHLAQRRGFLSNRKQITKKDDDEGKVKEGIAELRKAMLEKHTRTLGEHFSRLSPSDERIRSRWTARDMYKTEFNAIWDAQAAHHPFLLTPERKKELERAIFFQRPLWFDPKTIGQCELEPGQRRAPAYLLVAQRFRLLQKVNDLEIELPGEPPRYLTKEERAKLTDTLELQGDLSFHKGRKVNGRPIPSVRDLLGLPKTVSFNLQRGGEEKMPGNRTTSQFHSVFGERWLEMSAEEHNQAIMDILSVQKPETLKRRALEQWKLEEEAAHKFCNISLEPDYLNYSRKAIEKLLPLLEQGIPLATARMQTYPESFTSGEPKPFLPAVQQTLAEIRNPAVTRSLTELRKVTNAIIRQYGRPTQIHIELARDLKKSKKQREAISENNRRNEKSRADAASKIIKDAGIQEPKPVDIRKFLLAEECRWQCPYTGKSISMAGLFGPEPQFDIEHIIPFSRSMDNSFLNLTLCEVAENRSVKGNKTPYQAYSGDDAEYEKMKNRVKNFTGERSTVAAKLKRFTVDDDELEVFLEEFSNRQLNDTAYATRLAKRYLGVLYGGEVDNQNRRRVFARSGRATSDFRALWKLNGILNDGPTTGGGQAEKARSDHRHHAVDAVVIGLANDSMIQRLSRAAQMAPQLHRRLFGPLEGPWPNFVDTIRAEIGRIIVSHRPNRKVSGALHEETLYSRPLPLPGSSPGQKPAPRVRKPLAKITKAEVDDIADPTVREMVQKKLAQLGGDPRKFSVPENLPFFEIADGRKIPIKSVRVIKKTPTFSLGEGRRQRNVTSESNHHLEIFAELDEHGEEVEWDGVVVPLAEAFRRNRAHLPIMQKDFGPKRLFKFSISPGEVVECDGKAGCRELFVMRKASQLSSGQLQIGFAPINDARKAREMQIARTWLWANPETLRQRHPRKVAMNPLGELSEAHD